MTLKTNSDITFVRLTEISLQDLLTHMSDPRIRIHMPLLQQEWNIDTASRFVLKKEEYWQKDGLGHWAFLQNGDYVGWGGFQKEADEWDFGLVLRPNYFGLGLQITQKAMEFAKHDERIQFVTFLLPPSRKSLRAIERLGATFVGKVLYEEMPFLKYRLDVK